MINWAIWTKTPAKNNEKKWTTHEKCLLGKHLVGIRELTVVQNFWNRRKFRDEPNIWDSFALQDVCQFLKM